MKLKSHLAMLILGVLAGAGLLLAIWKPWRPPAATGRIVLTKPSQTPITKPKIPVMLPPAPTAQKRFQPGPSPACVQTLEPKDKKAAAEFERQFALKLDENALLAWQDLPPVPEGAQVVATVHKPTAGEISSGETPAPPQVELTVKAKPAPLFTAHWRKDLFAQGGPAWSSSGGAQETIFLAGIIPAEFSIKHRLRIQPAPAWLRVGRENFVWAGIRITCCSRR